MEFWVEYLYLFNQEQYASKSQINQKEGGWVYITLWTYIFECIGTYI